MRVAYFNELDSYAKVWGLIPARLLRGFALIRVW